MPRIIFRSNIDCVAEVNGCNLFCCREREAAIDCNAPCSMLIKVWPLCISNDVAAIPRACFLRMERDTPRGEAGDYSLRVEAAGCNAVNWGNGVIAVELPDDLCRCAYHGGVKILDSSFVFNRSERLKAELIYDEGVRLLLYNEKSKTNECFYLGEYGKGKLIVYDVGSRRLTAARLWERANAHEGAEERLIIIDENADSILEIEGDKAEIAEGCPERCVKLNTFRGHEIRERYEYVNGRFEIKDRRVIIPDSNSKLPELQAQRALCLVEAAGAEQYDEARGYMSSELSEGLKDESIRAFFGEFKRAELRPEPAMSGNRSVNTETELESVITVGIITKENESTRSQNAYGFHDAIIPRMFNITMRAGFAVDIEQVDQG